MLSPGKELMLLETLEFIGRVKAHIALRHLSGPGRFTEGGFSMPISLSAEAKEHMVGLEKLEAKIKQKLENLNEQTA